MKVLMISRATLFSSPGGDTIQIQNTAKYLRNLNIQVDIKTSDADFDYSSYDLLHFFNIIRPDDIIPHIQAANIPFVVSTIFVDYSEYEKLNRKGLPGIMFRFLGVDQIEYIKSLARALKNGEKIKSKYYLLHGHKKSVKYVSRKSSLLLPNSESEYQRFSKAYLERHEYMAIPNAVDPEVFDVSIAPDENYTGHIICVARIEGRKNQLNVVKAVNQTDYSMSFFGNSSPNHQPYFKACQEAAAANSRIRFISHLKQDQLVAVYQAAKVHVLASWFETTGLSTMEAALMGCNIVITEKGDTREYFKDFAFYCNPENVLSIRNSMEAAYKAPFNVELKNYILTHYTWEIAASKTLSSYHKVLDNSLKSI